MPSQFGSRLLAARRKRGLSLYRLAQLTTVSRPHLWRIETGRAEPSFDVAAVIAYHLRVSLDYFSEMPERKDNES